MKHRLALVGVLAIVLTQMGCGWMMPDGAPLVVYRRQGGSSLFISIWQMTVDVNGKTTVVGNPDTPLLETTKKVEIASSQSMAEIRQALDSEEMQSLRPEQLLEASQRIKAPKYTYTLIYGGRVLQTVAGAVPPEMMPVLRLLDQKLQLMESQATAPGIDQFAPIPPATGTPTRPAPSPLPPTKTRASATATPRR